MSESQPPQVLLFHTWPLTSDHREEVETDAAYSDHYIFFFCIIGISWLTLPRNNSTWCKTLLFSATSIYNVEHNWMSFKVQVKLKNDFFRPEIGGWLVIYVGQGSDRVLSKGQFCWWSDFLTLKLIYQYPCLLDISKARCWLHLIQVLWQTAS